MPGKQEIKDVLTKSETYLVDTLLPFWLERSVDRDEGGFLTYFDRDGNPTGETAKTFLMQIRMLYTMASAHRAGYGQGRCGQAAEMGARFILDHYWDDANEGWMWIADRCGRVIVADKVGYGQCFAMYAFSEYYLATGDARGREAAERTYQAIASHMADTRYGGYFEIMQVDWQPQRGGRCGGDRKSMDVHMHMMEALTNMYEMTGNPTHRRRLMEVIDLIIAKMLDRERGTGYMQFSLDFRPLAAILFDVEWGRDVHVQDTPALPVDTTSYGHNVEFAWLLLHAADILGQDRSTYGRVVRRICDNCIEFGIDEEYGGVFVNGPSDGKPTVMEKQFWQHAEVTIGMLDAYAMFGDEKYWDAFRDVYDFVFEKFVNMSAGGEWYERLDRVGRPIDDSLGHAWKISYHTVRSMIQTIRRLRALSGE